MFRSLRVRAPLFVSALILLVLAAMLVATHREIESTLTRAAHDRAADVARQLAEAFSRGMRANADSGPDRVGQRRDAARIAPHR